MLRTIPVAQLALRLKERLDALSTGDFTYSDGRTITEVIDDLYNRGGVIVVPPDDDPPLPVETVLFSESFDDGGDGDTASSDTTSATDFTGSGTGTLTHSQDWSRDGGTSLLLNGTDERLAHYAFPVTTAFFEVGDIRLGAVPGDDSFSFYLYAADGSTVAGRWGVTADGNVYLQDGTTGTGAGDDLSNSGLTVGGEYVWEWTCGAGTQRLAIWDLAHYNSHLDADAWDILTCTQTVTSFAQFGVGLSPSITTGGGGVSGNLVSESFEGDSNTQPANETTTTASSHSGTGVLTHSTTYAADGTLSLHVFGTVNETLRWVNASHVDHFPGFYFRYKTGPTGTRNAYPVQIRTGDNLSVAFQFGVQTDGKARIRDTNTGVTFDETTSALTTNTNYRVKIQALGAGGLTCWIYTGATIDSDDPADAWDTLTTTLTATSFADDQVGNISTVDTAVEYWIDRYKSDSVASPSPVGGGAGAPLVLYVDRLRGNNTSLPARATVTVIPPGVSGLLEPPPGKYMLGASTPPAGGSGTNLLGYNQYIAAGGSRPAILHWYKKAWNGKPTAAELALIEMSGEERAIVYYGWKVGGTQSMAQIASGAADAEINTGLAGIKTYAHTMMVTLWHEFDNNYNPSHPSAQQAADYVNMFRHVVARASALNVTNVVWCWNVTGHSKWAVDYPALYPGDDVVGAIFWDPYAHSGDPEFSDIVNETDTGGQAWWTGFYNWATTPNTLAASGSRPTGFSGAKPLGFGEWGVDHRGDTTGHTDAEAKAWLDSVTDQLPDFPRLRWLVYWNGLTANGDYQIQSAGPLCKAAYAAMNANALFDVYVSDIA